MQVAHLEQLQHLEDSYWWHVAKRELAVGLLERYFPAPGKLVEGGVGSARNLMTFQAMGYDVQGFDVMPESVAIAESRGVQAQLHDLAEPWPVADDSLTAVVLLDVIEHIADPVAVLKNARESLVEGGGVIVTVPAYQWLYSDWDQALGHFRRYTMKMLRDQADEAGLRVLQLTHWNAFTLPAAIAVRSYERLMPRHRAAEFPRVSAPTNNLLLRLAAAERWMMNKVPVPMGLSVVGVLAK